MIARTVAPAWKDPDAKKDWMVNWSDYLREGETLTSSVWEIDGPPDDGLVISSAPAQSYTTTTATVWIEGGTLGCVYRLRNRITTSEGRVDDQSIDVYMEAM